jgi:hypothetical protein
MNIIDLTPLETMGFSYNADTSVGGETVVMTRDFQDGAQLSDVADMFKRFLVACGFTYIADVRITTDDGAVFAASYA